MAEHTEYTAHREAKSYIHADWGKPRLLLDHAMATLNVGKDDGKTHYADDTAAWRRSGNWRSVNTDRVNTRASTEETTMPSRRRWRELPASSQRSPPTTSRFSGIKMPKTVLIPPGTTQPSTNKTNLTSLSPDIWILILTFIPPSTKKHILPSPPPNGRSISIPMLLSLIHVSRDLYSALLPLLYHTVNLTPAKTSDATLAYRHRSLTCLAQWKFVRSILARPELGQWVRELCWATGLENSKGFVPEMVGVTKVRWREEDVWAVFGAMENAVKVSIEGGQAQVQNRKVGSLRDEEENLFPGAQHVNLSGTLPHALVRAILHGKDKMPLYSLTLDQLQDSTPRPFRYLDTRPSSKPDPAERQPYMPRSVYAPPAAPSEPEVRDMLSVLTERLYERCERLNELSVTITKHSSASSTEPEAAYSGKGKGKATQSGRDQKEKEETPIDIFYNELASFLSAVPAKNVSITLPSPTFSFESRPSGGRTCRREFGRRTCGFRSERTQRRFPGRPGASYDTPLALDEVKIRDTLIPVLVQCWKGKSVTVKGIQWNAVCALAVLRTRDEREGGRVRVVCDGEIHDDVDADEGIVCAKPGNGLDAGSSVEGEWNRKWRLKAQQPDVPFHPVRAGGERSPLLEGVVGENSRDVPEVVVSEEERTEADGPRGAIGWVDEHE